MRNVKLLALSLIGVAAGGGIAFAATDSSSPTSIAVTAAPPSTHSGLATLNATTVQVAGKSESILETAAGLPLYYYADDTPTVSKVSGGLAALWPPLESSSPTESGTSGTVSVVNGSLGPQVQYDGHFLYTFVSDSPGHPTGQGVQNFYLATPTGAPGATVVIDPAQTPSSSSSYGGY